MQLTRFRNLILLQLLVASILINLSALGQYDTVYKHRIQGILIEYSNNFNGLIGNAKLSGVPKRLFIEPGLEGGIDELHIWGDTSFNYISVIREKEDSNTTRKVIFQLDKKLQIALGNQFKRYLGILSFSKETEIPITYKSENIQVTIIVGKINRNQYMSMLVFTGPFKYDIGIENKK